MKRLLLALALVGCNPPPGEGPDEAAAIVWGALQAHAWAIAQRVPTPTVIYREPSRGCTSGFQSVRGCVTGLVSYPASGPVVEVVRAAVPSAVPSDWGHGPLPHELCHLLNFLGGQPDNGEHDSHCFKDLSGNVPWATEANEALRAAGY